MRKNFLIYFLLSISFLNLFANDNKKVNLQNIVIETPNEIKKEKDYEENTLSTQVKKIEKTSKKIDDDIIINGGVNFNKKNKSVDSAEINIGTKF